MSPTKFNSLIMKTRFRLSLLLSLFAVTLAYAVPGVPGPAPKEAWIIPVENNWELKSKLPVQLMYISLQGLANTDAPRVFIEYPPEWHFHDFIPVKDFYANHYGIKFTRLETPEAVLAALSSFAEGYVIWDQNERASINVALTAAGLMRGVVIDASLIPLVEQHGLKPLADFRNKFAGMSDIEIYQWAYDEYWEQCSRDYIIWMGGHVGRIMEPGVADLAIATKAFVTDLSANPAHVEELALHRSILEQLKPTAWIIGWHSYGKDTEAQWVTLTSSYGIKVMGLNSFPNATFMSQIDFSPDFKFTNYNHVTRESTLMAEDKVYLCLVQSDSMGIGAWTEPERGQIPYNWEVGVDGAQWYPAVMQMFAQDKSPNDYFIGGQSGYMYPMLIPHDKFPGLMQEMNERMAKLDEHTVTIMDHTDHGIPIGYFDLRKATVDEYYANVPDAIGFINGYAAAHTFDLRNGQAFMSYDYYLSEKRPIEYAVADLDELMKLNPTRPYYMLVHVRESNSIKRVMEIIGKLGESPEIVPLDTFLKLAASKKTYKTRYKTEPISDEVWNVQAK